MPNRDGKGPLGKGPRTGRMGANSVSSDCTCPACGYKESHQRGIPCSEKTCPKCKAAMKGANCLNS